MSTEIPSKKLLALRLICAVLLLAASEGLRRFFASFKKPPAKIEQAEKVHYIDAVNVSKMSHTIYLEGYGVIRSAEQVSISSEVAGIVKKVNLKLEPGLIIKKDEIIFEVEKKDYSLAVDLMNSKIKVIDAQISEMQNDLKFAKDTIKLQEKEIGLAKRELERQRQLLDRKIGSEAQKEIAERALLNAENLLLGAKQKASAQENRINTLQQQKLEAEQATKIEQNRLEKCIVRAPKDLRVVDRMLEEGQMLMMGSKVAVLEDNQNLEIPVMIPGPEMVRWINLEKDKQNLFEALKESPAKVLWIENEKETLLATGKLTRIENYNSSNRMVKALVTLDSIKSVTATGMFCKVQIQGRKIDDVFRVPRVALNKRNEAMVIEDGKLKFYPADIVFTDGDYHLIRGNDLKEKHIFVNSKLANPVEGMKVQAELPVDEKG